MKRALASLITYPIAIGGFLMLGTLLGIYYVISWAFEEMEKR